MCIFSTRVSNLIFSSNCAINAGMRSLESFFPSPYIAAYKKREKGAKEREREIALTDEATPVSVTARKGGTFSFKIHRVVRRLQPYYSYRETYRESARL